jgi:hypothetical protein
MPHRARKHGPVTHADPHRTRRSSDVQSIWARTRRLVIDTGLRGEAAGASWVTVTDPLGATCFEGAPSADGQVEVWLDATARVEKLCVLIETATLHRQTEIALDK